MPSLKDIKRRIGSVKNTQKITRAMKLVAVARLRKAQDDIQSLRPYAVRTHDMLSALAARVDDADKHPLLRETESPKRVLIVVLSSDRGLAGGFNSSITKQTQRLWTKLTDEGKDVHFAVIGRKAKGFLQRRDAAIDKVFENVFENASLGTATDIANYIVGRYAPTLVSGEAGSADAMSGEAGAADLDACYLIYNEFKSAIQQDVVVEQMLPIKRAALTEDLSEVVFEPSEAAVLDETLQLYVRIEVFRALLESIASEHGARMTAMEAATNNAGDIIDKLTLQYNRARQAAITKELMEIISGAEALNG